MEIWHCILLASPLQLTSITAHFNFYIQQTGYNILISVLQSCYYICNAYTRARLAVSLYFQSLRQTNCIPAPALYLTHKHESRINQANKCTNYRFNVRALDVNNISNFLTKGGKNSSMKQAVINTMLYNTFYSSYFKNIVLIFRGKGCYMSRIKNKSYYYYRKML